MAKWFFIDIPDQLSAALTGLVIQKFQRLTQTVACAMHVVPALHQDIALAELAEKIVGFQMAEHGFYIGREWFQTFALPRLAIACYGKMPIADASK